MKVIKFPTPNGEYVLPLLKVAEHRANYYAIKGRYKKESEDYKEEVKFVLEDDFEGIDWLLNSTNFEDWEDDAQKVSELILVLPADFWCESDKFEIVEMEIK